MPHVTKKSKKEQQYTLSNEIVLCSKFPEDCQNFYMPEKEKQTYQLKQFGTHNKDKDVSSK